MGADVMASLWAKIGHTLERGCSVRKNITGLTGNLQCSDGREIGVVSCLAVGEKWLGKTRSIMMSCCRNVWYCVVLK